eukprot:687459-Hanusia_phi.AAC.1
MSSISEASLSCPPPARSRMSVRGAARFPWSLTPRSQLVILAAGMRSTCPLLPRGHERHVVAVELDADVCGEVLSAHPAHSGASQQLECTPAPLDVCWGIGEHQVHTGLAAAPAPPQKRSAASGFHPHHPPSSISAVALWM